MSKSDKVKKVKPGGDKFITWSRVIGDVIESTVSKLLTAATIAGLGALVVRGATDLRVMYNKRKMKGGNTDERWIIKFRESETSR